MNIVLKNDGVLSLIDMMTMGDSVKREDDSKIGQFDSGLKYALSILFRNGIETSVYSDNVQYTFSSKTQKDDLTHKVKELLVINRTIGKEVTEYITSFSPNLGFEWKVWMAIRELYSNCLDEGGDVQFVDEVNIEDSTNKTLIVIYDNSLLREMIKSWNSYFIPNDLDPLYEKNGLKIYKNESDCLKIYKNHILIYYDKHVKSGYIYDYSRASIDEMRMLNNLDTVRDSISTTICNCDDITFIKDFLSYREEGSFEAKLNYYYGFSTVWSEIVNKLHDEGSLFLFPNMKKEMAESNKFNIGLKRVSYNSPAYSYCKVEIEEVEEKELTFEEKILDICNKFKFTVEYPIIESKITRFTCIPNLHEKVIYVTSEFAEENMWEMVKAVFRINGKDDTDYVYHKYIELLK